MANIGVFATILDAAGQLLLVRQNYADRLWTQPGGRVEPNESPLDALHREVREETGHRIAIERFVGAYSRTYDDDLVLAFIGRSIASAPWTPDDEISAIGFFAPDRLPEPMTLRTRLRIADALAGRSGLVRVYDAPENLRASFPDQL
jgi:8-oxo-dGTP pyrophosphatase MutT (NUDIX family)